MSSTISARSENGFKVEVFDWNNKPVYSAYHADRNEAEATRAHWERLVTLNLVDGEPVMTLDELMNDEDLLRELLG